MDFEKEDEGRTSGVPEKRIPNGYVERGNATAPGAMSRQVQLPLDLDLTHLTDEIYKEFAGWPDATQREKLGQFASAGAAAVVPLLRILESYRTPDGAASTLPLKTMVCRQLGQLGDERAVYYLCQQISLADPEDEANSAVLRHVAAEAIGRIVGQPFTPDASGLQAARDWWSGPGRGRYDQLAF